MLWSVSASLALPSGRNASASGVTSRIPRSACAVNCGACRPSTNTMRCASMAASSSSAASISRVESSCRSLTAGGRASLRALRKSVHFHCSMRRCGSPSAAKVPMAALRASAMALPPGSFAATASKLRESACSALVRVEASVMVAPASSTLEGLELGIAALLELDSQLLATGLADLTVGHHVHFIRHDVVEEPLIMGDDEHRPVLRPKLIDARGDDAHGIDVEAGVGLIEHAQAGCQHRHLQDFHAL